MFLTAVRDFVGTGSTFTFDRSTRAFNYSVTIVNDDVYEFNENFFAQLNFIRPAARVSIDPASAQVQIVDEDGE